MDMSEARSTSLANKWFNLKEILRGYKSAAIAFSGGVDSTLLLFAAHEALGDQMAAITATAPFFPEREQKEASEICRQLGVKHIHCTAEAMSLPAFTENPADRCYICKKHVFGRIQQIAEENGLAVVCEGTNRDDEGDYRPGMRAIAELKIKSPLREADLYKEEIRALSRHFGLPTADKPSFACLASRFPYGETITQEKLKRIDLAEQFLQDLGFRQVRVRIHGEMARIEVMREQMDDFLRRDIRTEVNDRLKELGFSYVTVDLAGFRSGSMNEVLNR